MITVPIRASIVDEPLWIECEAERHDRAQGGLGGVGLADRDVVGRTRDRRVGEVLELAELHDGPARHARSPGTVCGTGRR